MVVCFLGALALLVGLGAWQLQRLAWKRDLLATVEAHMSAPPLALPAEVADPAALDFRRVSASGRFAHGRELYLAGRNRRGRPGVHVVTPLLREGGAAVLVNRGWVPLDKKDPASRAAGQVSGTVTVTGIARVPRPPGMFVPENDPAKGFWMTVDIAAMAAAARVAPVLPVIVEADATPNPGGLPIGGVTRIDYRNDHLQYALTWFALAVALVIIFVVYHRSPREEQR